jgi:hypothetical protein
MQQPRQVVKAFATAKREASAAKLDARWRLLPGLAGSSSRSGLELLSEFL